MRQAGGRLAAEHENVYVELSSTHASIDVVRETVRVAGSDKLLFGTDVPVVDPRAMLGLYLDAITSPGGLDLALRENAARVFALRDAQLPEGQRASIPRSSGSAAPVMPRASEDASHAMTEAISSGSRTLGVSCPDV